jgi:hypothetical protein
LLAPRVEGNIESEDTPRADLLEVSPEARRDDRMEPVVGHTRVIEPPPPDGVKEFIGLEVEMQSTCLFVIIIYGVGEPSSSCGPSRTTRRRKKIILRRFLKSTLNEWLCDG